VAGPGPTAEQVRALRTPTLLVLGQDILSTSKSLQSLIAWCWHSLRTRVCDGCRSAVYRDLEPIPNRARAFGPDTVRP
jgi:hypothetical protein